MSTLKRTLECRWQHFFSNPAQWWDHRLDKVVVKYPDFTNKKTREGLWVGAKLNPKWVEKELAEMEPGTLHRSPFSWNVELLKYVKDGQDKKALDLFRELNGKNGVRPDLYTFVPVLNACASLGQIEAGRQIHEQVIENGYESDVFVATSLLNMYAKCGSIEDARRIFDRMPTRTVVSWNAMIRAYVKCGRSQEALDLYGQMTMQKKKCNAVKPDLATFVGLLNACAALPSLEKGRWVHEQITQRGLETKVAVGNSLVDMYAKCGSIENAQRVFDRMPTRDVVSWNAIIAGHVKCGQAQQALDISRKMMAVAVAGEVVEPDSVTFVGIVSACSSLGALDEGRLAHEQVIQRGLESDVFVGSSLVDMYAKCRSMEDAWKVFSRMPKRSAVAWNAIISGYVRCGHPEKALGLARQMHHEKEVKPDSITFVRILNACAATLDIEEGRRVHTQITQSNLLENNTYIKNSLVAMYAKCGSIDEAFAVFNSIQARTVVSWNAMIGGYVKCGQGQKALDLYKEMQSENVKPNDITFIQLLNACASIGTPAALEEGRKIHAQVRLHNHAETADSSVRSSLVDMYVKCGSMGEASKVFNEQPTTRDVVAWNAMIMGFVRRGEGRRALKLFRRMQAEGVKPEPLTFVGVLNACASVAAFDEGSRVHAQIFKSGFQENLFVINGLIDMYAKCGSLEHAWRVFDKIPAPDTVSWNSLLGGCATHGYGQEALQIFERMCQERVEINRITFVSLLSACSHAGLVDEGLQYLECMGQHHGVSALLEHFSCLVDLLSRSGRLHEADDLIKSMPFEPDVVAWKALLGGCRVHGNVEIGDRVGWHVLQLVPASSPLLLLSNIYVNAGKWESKAQGKQTMMMDRGVKKPPESTWMVIGEQVHTFTADDQEHPQMERIRSELRRLLREIEKLGYVPDTSSLLCDVKEEEEEDGQVCRLWSHSEKLAVAFGLLNTAPGTPLRILKNLRMCDDCHEAIKLIAKVSEREIVVRDSTRFHHFNNNACSCNDYW